MSIEKKEVNDFIEKQEIRWVVVNFIDLNGEHRNISLPSSSFLTGTAWDSIDFDGSSVGFAAVEKSDMSLIPDPNSYWTDPFSDNTLNLHASICNSEGEKIGPRSVLMKIIKEYEALGLTPHISPEMEFYVFENIKQAIMENDFMGADMDLGGKNVMHSLLGFNDSSKYPVRAKQAYLTANVHESLRDFRDKLSDLLISAGYQIRYHHHEGGRRQLEIETGYFPAMKAADYIVNFKYLAKGLGKEWGLLPTFMPKPSAYDAGNGMHFHIMLKNGEKNAFSNDAGELNETAKHFIAGLMEHAPALCSFTNPTINSYRRLMPGFEAPVVIAWSRGNRTALIRVPGSAKGEKCNIEIRNPDTSANPYLAAAAILAAGLDGIKRKLEAPPEAVGNLYECNESPMLPTILDEALEATSEDEIILDAIGRDLFEIIKARKKKEICQYRKQIPIFDFNRYYDV
ncbi:MAG: glutamine synthetase [Thermoplasmata archaeon]|nr:glutamine synthetase [Thermoplasmata archaeon]